MNSGSYILTDPTGNCSTTAAAINTYIKSYTKGIESSIGCVGETGRLKTMTPSRCSIVIKALNAAVDDFQNAQFGYCDTDVSRPLHYEAIKITFDSIVCSDFDELAEFVLIKILKDAVISTGEVVDDDIVAVEINCIDKIQRRRRNNMDFTSRHRRAEPGWSCVDIGGQGHFLTTSEYSADVKTLQELLNLCGDSAMFLDTFTFSTDSNGNGKHLIL